MPQETPKTATGRIEFNAFPGMVLNADPNDLPPGAAQLQVNVTSAIPGELNVRKGFVPVRFENM